MRNTLCHSKRSEGSFLLPLLILLTLFLTGCTGFTTSYVVEEDFNFPERREEDTLNSIGNISQLRAAILNAVSRGLEESLLIFDPDYNGNISQDLASAVWQLRTEDALCAYCVENMSYERRTFISHTEAVLSVSYSPVTVPVDEIIRMNYVTGLDGIISTAIASGEGRIAVLINHVNLTKDTLLSRISEEYRKNPLIAPQEPSCHVEMFTGAGSQRLFEIQLDYGSEYEQRKAELDRLSFTAEGSEADRARYAAEALRSCCDESAPGTVYDALVLGCASSEGTALAYVALCREAGLECRIVYGQKDWVEHCWNIVRVDGSWFHVDLCAEDGFLKSDADFWESYRWTTSAYPKCITPAPSSAPILSS